jgi:hypothetical protein
MTMAFLIKTGAAEAPRHRFTVDMGVVVLAVVLLGTTILNFTAYAGQPLGVDEVWTGMIAGQGSVAAMIHQCEIEVNGPLSYVVSWLWAPLGGHSNTGLRLPSTLFACATPFVALAPHRLVPPTVRVVWALLLACWLPEFAFAQLARCYALVVLLATANTVAFARLMSRPGLGAAALWSVLSALLILDHYFALVIVACQGFAYLGLKRGQAARTWPAALIFLPALSELAFKVAILSQFAKPGVSWIDRITLADLPNLVGFLAGSLFFAGVVVVGLSVGWIMDIRRSRQSETPRKDDNADPLMIAAAMAAIAAVISVGLGVVFPILTPRYLTPEVPGLMLAVALMAYHFSRAWPLLPVLIAASAISAVIGLAAHTGFVSQPAVTAFSFERAAKALMADNARGLVFFWDNPVAQGGDPQQLSDVGEFFFKRTGRAIPVEAVTFVGGKDPNAVLLSKAKAPGTGILWMFDRDVAGTAAVAYPPDISRRDPRWACHDFGAGDIGILACHRRAAV